MNWNSPLQFNTHLLRTVKKSQSPSFRHWVWRTWFVARSRNPEAGFILPTVVFMLLIMSLVISVLTFRTFSRTVEVSGQRQQRSLYNAATPAIDRSKAKLEYLFSETNLTSLPTDSQLEDALKAPTSGADRFLIPGETRVDINNDGTVDNAWSYGLDSNGDGNNDVLVIYSILHQSSATDDNGTIVTTDDTPVELESTDQLKADNLVVRNGPINLNKGSNPNCPDPDLSIYDDWESTGDTATLRKAFQVHAVTVALAPGSTDNTIAVNPTFATLEMQQDRQGVLGNRWGAWFLYDLEMNNNGLFYWNGAMHTEANFFFGEQGNAGSFRLYLVSSPSSCVYTRTASEVSMTQRDTSGDDVYDANTDFQGQLMIGRMVDNSLGTTDTFEIDPFVSSGTPTSEIFNSGGASGRKADSVVTTTTDGVNVTPSGLSVDPVTLFVQGIPKYLNSTFTPTKVRDTTSWTSALKILSSERVKNAQEPLPFVDDTYRADDRWGPKPLYGFDGDIALANMRVTGTAAQVKTGDSISGSFYDISTGDAIDNTDLTRTAPTDPDNESDFGLDGYWERRAKAQGVRVVVGQRLELGNAFGWGADTNGDKIRDVDDEPLYPPNSDTAITSSSMSGRESELQHWRTLRDNLAAVQSAAIYHYNYDHDGNGTVASSEGGSYPIACLASTVHPGTSATDSRSRTFNTVIGDETAAKTDFNGDGDTSDTTVTLVINDFIGSVVDEDANNNGTLDTGEDANGNGRLDAPGEGTNGLEFSPPFAGNPTTFAAQINNSDSPLRLALSNLAYFAGDPAGAFPAMQDAEEASDSNAAKIYGNFAAGSSQSTGVVHPYPYLSMWGDFSNLRRVITKLQSGTTYANLSIADQTTLQTATCTLGMLAYGIVSSQASESTEGKTSLSGSNLSHMTNFAAEADRMLDCNTSNGDAWKYTEDLNGDGNLNTDLGDGISEDINKDGVLQTNVDRTPDPQEDGTTCTAATRDHYYSGVTLEQMAGAMRLQSGGGGLPGGVSELDALRSMKKAMVYLEKQVFQVDRDRTYGFETGTLPQSGTAPSGYNGGDWWTSSTPQAPYGNGANKSYLSTGCDPYIFMDSTGPFGSDALATNQTDKAVALAFAACSTFTTTKSTPRYPALYYIFPKADHAQDGLWTDLPTATQTAMASAGGIKKEQSTTGDDYVDQTANRYIFDRTGARGVNFGYIYRTVEDAGSLGNGNRVAGSGESLAEFVNYLGITPRTATTNWKTPITTTSTGRVNSITYNGTTWYTAFLDTALFDGRQLMNVRTMRLDLDLMRRTPFQTDTSGESHWLPLPDLVSTGSLIYAFREDSQREDGVERPKNTGTTWADCDTAAEIVTANCRMVVTSSTPQDPPVSSTTGISPKPVDFYPDPLRRVNGFWFANGSDLRRLRNDTSAYIADQQRGFTFVTPDSLYVQGDFNLHTNDGSTIIEEFTTPLNLTTTASTNWNNFYSRSSLHSDFAREYQQGTTTTLADRWRPTELLADAVTILSSTFTAGFLDQGIGDNEGTRTTASRNSYRAINQPYPDTANVNNLRGDTENFASSTWIRENGSTGGSTDTDLPIKISRLNFPMNTTSTSSTDEWGRTGPANTEDFKTFLENRGVVNSSEGNWNDNSAVAHITDTHGSTATTAYFNATLVQGIVPNQTNQGYGGLPNFPRLMEDWAASGTESSGVSTLRIAGALFQLNFNTIATGPFDQDAWEPGAATSTNEYIAYYARPTRAWGFDVGLLYAPPGMVAQRLAINSLTRSEFYRELPVDDPYIEDLLCAKIDTTNYVIVNTSDLPFDCP